MIDTITTNAFEGRFTDYHPYHFEPYKPTDKERDWLTRIGGFRWDKHQVGYWLKDQQARNDIADEMDDWNEKFGFNVYGIQKSWQTIRTRYLNRIVMKGNIDGSTILNQRYELLDGVGLFKDINIDSDDNHRCLIAAFRRLQQEGVKRAKISEVMPYYCYQLELRNRHYRPVEEGDLDLAQEALERDYSKFDLLDIKGQVFELDVEEVLNDPWESLRPNRMLFRLDVMKSNKAYPLCFSISADLQPLYFQTKNNFDDMSEEEYRGMFKAFEAAVKREGLEINWQSTNYYLSDSEDDPWSVVRLSRLDIYKDAKLEEENADIFSVLQYLQMPYQNDAWKFEADNGGAWYFGNGIQKIRSYSKHACNLDKGNLDGIEAARGVFRIEISYTNGEKIQDVGIDYQTLPDQYHHIRRLFNAEMDGLFPYPIQTVPQKPIKNIIAFIRTRLNSIEGINRNTQLENIQEVVQLFQKHGSLTSVIESLEKKKGGKKKGIDKTTLMSRLKLIFDFDLGCLIIPNISLYNEMKTKFRYAVDPAASVVPLESGYSGRKKKPNANLATGVAAIDDLFADGGKTPGIPGGKIIALTGGKHVGKTRMLIDAVRNLIQRKKQVLFLDFDRQTKRFLTKEDGQGQLKPGMLHLANPVTYERTTDLLRAVIDERIKLDIVVIDSLNSILIKLTEGDNQFLRKKMNVGFKADQDQKFFEFLKYFVEKTGIPVLYTNWRLRVEDKRKKIVKKIQGDFSWREALTDLEIRMGVSKNEYDSRKNFDGEENLVPVGHTAKLYLLENGRGHQISTFYVTYESTKIQPVGQPAKTNSQTMRNEEKSKAGNFLHRFVDTAKKLGDKVIKFIWKSEHG
jgi:hypothetical protein